MNHLELKIFPEPCLRITTRTVDDFGEDLEFTARRMAEIMYLNQGIGLAAPQVGLGLSLIVVDTGGGLEIFVNPEVAETSREKDAMEEGCLSLPCVTVKVARSARVKIRCHDLSGGISLKSFDGLMARVLQHEIDHLSGRLILDYMNPISRLVAEKKLVRHSRTCRRPDLRL